MLVTRWGRTLRTESTSVKVCYYIWSYAVSTLSYDTTPYSGTTLYTVSKKSVIDYQGDDVRCCSAQHRTFQTM